jgi:hypothetical protein
VRSANALYRADVMTEGAHQDSLYKRVLEAQRRSNNFTGSHLRSGTVSAGAVGQRGSEQARVRLVERVLADELQLLPLVLVLLQELRCGRIHTIDEVRKQASKFIKEYTIGEHSVQGTRGNWTTIQAVRSIEHYTADASYQ